jgi:hypothetical protein
VSLVPARLTIRLARASVFSTLIVRKSWTALILTHSPCLTASFAAARTYLELVPRLRTRLLSCRLAILTALQLLSLNALVK